MTRLWGIIKFTLSRQLPLVGTSDKELPNPAFNMKHQPNINRISVGNIKGLRALHSWAQMVATWHLLR